MSEIKLFPSWKQAAKELIDAGLEPGKIIAKADLERLFGIEPAQSIKCLTSAGQMVGLGDYRPRFGRFEVLA